MASLVDRRGDNRAVVLRGVGVLAGAEVAEAGQMPSSRSRSAIRRAILRVWPWVLAYAIRTLVMGMVYPARSRRSNSSVPAAASTRAATVTPANSSGSIPSTAAEP